jgi:mediator of RNA polymerase II transcription subunit 6
VTKLTNLFAKASTLPLFTPSFGHTYQVHAAKATNVKDNTSTVAPSKEGSPSGGGGESTRATQQPLDSTQSTSSSTAPRRARKAADPRNLLQQSIQLAERFRGEDMDSTPLQGEPGAFVMKKGGAPKGTAAGSKGNNTGAITTAAPTAPTAPPASALAATRPDAPPVPPLQTEFLDEDRKRKGSSLAEKTPNTASPITPSGSKRRKKSKIGPLSGGEVTPTTVA